MNASDDSANTDRCKLYEDSVNFLKDERFSKTANLWKIDAEDTRITTSWCVKVRQNVSKRLKARQMCVDDENAISKKPPLWIAQDTQHKLGVAFSYLEHNNTINWDIPESFYFSFFHQKVSTVNYTEGG